MERAKGIQQIRPSVNRGYTPISHRGNISLSKSAVPKNSLENQPILVSLEEYAGTEAPSRLAHLMGYVVRENSGCSNDFFQYSIAFNSQELCDFIVKSFNESQYPHTFVLGGQAAGRVLVPPGPNDPPLPDFDFLFYLDPNSFNPNSYDNFTRFKTIVKNFIRTRLVVTPKTSAYFYFRPKEISNDIIESFITKYSPIVDFNTNDRFLILTVADFIEIKFIYSMKRNNASRTDGLQILPLTKQVRCYDVHTFCPEREIKKTINLLKSRECIFTESHKVRELHNRLLLMVTRGHNYQLLDWNNAVEGILKAIRALGGSSITGKIYPILSSSMNFMNNHYKGPNHSVTEKKEDSLHYGKLVFFFNFLTLLENIENQPERNLLISGLAKAWEHHFPTPLLSPLIKTLQESPDYLSNLLAILQGQLILQSMKKDSHIDPYPVFNAGKQHIHPHYGIQTPHGRYYLVMRKMKIEETMVAYIKGSINLQGEPSIDLAISRMFSAFALEPFQNLSEQIHQFVKNYDQSLISHEIDDQFKTSLTARFFLSYFSADQQISDHLPWLGFCHVCEGLKIRKYHPHLKEDLKLCELAKVGADFFELNLSTNQSEKIRAYGVLLKSYQESSSGTPDSFNLVKKEFIEHFFSLHELILSGRNLQNILALNDLIADAKLLMKFSTDWQLQSTNTRLSLLRESPSFENKENVINGLVEELNNITFATFQEEKYTDLKEPLILFIKLVIAPLQNNLDLTPYLSFISDIIMKETIKRFYDTFASENDIKESYLPFVQSFLTCFKRRHEFSQCKLEPAVEKIIRISLKLMPVQKLLHERAEHLNTVLFLCAAMSADTAPACLIDLSTTLLAGARNIALQYAQFDPADQIILLNKNIRTWKGEEKDYALLGQSLDFINLSLQNLELNENHLIQLESYLKALFSIDDLLIDQALGIKLLNILRKLNKRQDFNLEPFYGSFKELSLKCSNLEIQCEIANLSGSENSTLFDNAFAVFVEEVISFSKTQDKTEKFTLLLNTLISLGNPFQQSILRSLQKELNDSDVNLSTIIAHLSIVAPLQTASLIRHSKTLSSIKINTLLPAALYVMQNLDHEKHSQVIIELWNECIPPAKDLEPLLTVPLASDIVDIFSQFCYPSHPIENATLISKNETFIQQYKLCLQYLSKQGVRYEDFSPQMKIFKKLCDELSKRPQQLEQFIFGCSIQKFAKAYDLSNFFDSHLLPQNLLCGYFLSAINTAIKAKQLPPITTAKLLNELRQSPYVKNEHKKAFIENWKSLIAVADAPTLKKIQGMLSLLLSDENYASFKELTQLLIDKYFSIPEVEGAKGALAVVQALKANPNEGAIHTYRSSMLRCIEKIMSLPKEMRVKAKIESPSKTTPTNKLSNDEVDHFTESLLPQLWNMVVNSPKSARQDSPGKTFRPTASQLASIALDYPYTDIGKTAVSYVRDLPSFNLPLAICYLDACILIEPESVTVNFLIDMYAKIKGSIKTPTDLDYLKFLLEALSKEKLIQIYVPLNQLITRCVINNPPLILGNDALYLLQAMTIALSKEIPEIPFITAQTQFFLYLLKSKEELKPFLKKICVNETPYLTTNDIDNLAPLIKSILPVYQGNTLKLIPLQSLAPQPKKQCVLKDDFLPLPGKTEFHIEDVEENKKVDKLKLSHLKEQRESPKKESPTREDYPGDHLTPACRGLICDILCLIHERRNQIGELCTLTELAMQDYMVGSEFVKSSRKQYEVHRHIINHHSIVDEQSLILHTKEILLNTLGYYLFDHDRGLEELHKLGHLILDQYSQCLSYYVPLLLQMQNANSFYESASTESSTICSVATYRHTHKFCLDPKRLVEKYHLDWRLANYVIKEVEIKGETGFADLLGSQLTCLLTSWNQGISQHNDKEEIRTLIRRALPIVVNGCPHRIKAFSIEFIKSIKNGLYNSLSTTNNGSMKDFNDSLEERKGIIRVLSEVLFDVRYNKDLKLTLALTECAIDLIPHFNELDFTIITDLMQANYILCIRNLATREFNQLQLYFDLQNKLFKTYTNTVYGRFLISIYQINVFLGQYFLFAIGEMAEMIKEKSEKDEQIKDTLKRIPREFNFFDLPFTYVKSIPDEKVRQAMKEELIINAFQVIETSDNSDICKLINPNTTIHLQALIQKCFRIFPGGYCEYMLNACSKLLDSYSSSPTINPNSLFGALQHVYESMPCEFEKKFFDSYMRLQTITFKVVLQYALMKGNAFDLQHYSTRYGNYPIREKPKRLLKLAQTHAEIFSGYLQMISFLIKENQGPHLYEKFQEKMNRIEEETESYFVKMATGDMPAVTINDEDDKRFCILECIKMISKVDPEYIENVFKLIESQEFATSLETFQKIPK